jgi:nitrate reductase alpha subunit
MITFFKNLSFFKKLSGDNNREWESFYRNRWQHDKVVRSTHGVNCTGSCSWRIFVKKGIVTWELQQTDYPENAPGIPNNEPRGCPRGASYSWYLYNSGRVKHPLIRRELIELYEKGKQETGDPVKAWESIASDKKNIASYQKVRGLGGFVRLDWDTATEIIAAANIYTIKRYGPDRIVGFTPIPAFSMVSYGAGTRYLSLIGGTCLSFYDFYCDLPPSSPQTWGEQTDVPESADWFNAAYLMLWGSNVPVTRTPDSPFLTQVRYKGTPVVVVSPDYSEASKFADLWLAPKQGTDSALGMAMGHVVLKEYFVDKTTPYFDEYVKKFTDLPFLIKLKKEGDGYVSDQLLRASDFADNMGIAASPEWYPVLRDEENGEMVLPNGSIGSRWNDEGKWNLKNEDVRTGKPFTPRLTVYPDCDDIIDVKFPYFGGAEYQNPNWNATKHPDILVRKVPVVKVMTKEGEIYCTNVFDLMLAHYGVDRGIDDENVAKDYDDDVPYTPKWQEAITGVKAENVIKVARDFASTAEKTHGRSMIIIGAGVNQWYNTDMTYRAAINLLILCGTCGKSGGGWAHYVGQEKVRPQAGWATMAFATDWIRPPRHMNTTSYIYMHSDQWRYERVKVASQLSPLKPREDWNNLTLLDCNIKSQRMGWLPTSPELSRNPLSICNDAKAEGKDVKEYITEHLQKGDLSIASEHIDTDDCEPKNLFIWRSNLIGSSAKGVEYFMKYMLGTQHNVLGKTLDETGDPLPIYEDWKRDDETGKLQLVVTIDYRMTTSSLHSDIVLPAATWYEKNDISSTDMHQFLHPFCQAVNPVWESRTDWDIYKNLAEKFSELCVGHLGVEKDVVMTPLSHDSAAEIANATIDDWKVKGERPIPGKTMGGLVCVERDYPNTFKRFTSLGPLVTNKGMAAKGIGWSAKEEVDYLKLFNGEVKEEGTSKELPLMETDIQACDTILALDPASNGAAAFKAWKALEKPTGVDLAIPLTKEDGETHLRYRDLVEQPRRALNSPVWSGVNSKTIPYTANYTNVEFLIPWRTLTGRQSFYQDHPWMLDFGENLATYKPPLAKKEITDLKERQHITDPTLTLNLITPHFKWTVHSSWADNLLMLTLGRGGPVIWMSEKDASKLNIKDNDWVETINDHGTTIGRAIVSQRIPEGMLFMYHNQERTINMPISPLTKHRGGIHNSISRICPKPSHMIGGYAQLSYSLNYYGTIGANRDEFVLLRRLNDNDIKF